MEKSKSELLLESILKKIESIDIHHINLFNRDVNGIKPELVQKEIEQLIMQLYDTSIIDNYYYLDCSIDVYINTYEERLKVVGEDVKGLTEVFFLKSELEDLIDPEYRFSKTNLSEFRKYCRNTFYNSSFNSKIEFIRNKLLALGHIVNIAPEIYQIPEYSNYRSYNTSNVDYKYDPSFINKIVVVSKDSSLNDNINPKQLTANQSIILLDKLGFFTHSDIENLPQTKQANIISQITGLNEKNINKRISKLEQNQKEISKNYQKDIDKINKILDDLE